MLSLADPDTEYLEIALGLVEAGTGARAVSVEVPRRQARDTLCRHENLSAQIFSYLADGIMPAHFFFQMK